MASASGFLNLDEAGETIAAIKLALAERLRDLRKEHRLTHQKVANKSVSLERFVRSLISLGASQTQIGGVIGCSGARENRSLPAKAKKWETVTS